MNVFTGVSGTMMDFLDGDCSAGQPRGSDRVLKVLLAEDNAVNRVATQLILQHLGHRADVAVNGVEVLQAVDREDYDVVLMDLQMPLMDGLEAARRLRDGRHRGRLPRIIALSASDAGEERELCLASGMQDFLRKPIRLDDLSVALARCQDAAP